MKMFSSLGRAMRWHRRLVAAVLAGVAVVIALSSLSRGQTIDTTAVVVATRLVPAGTVLTADDVVVSNVPSVAVPESAVTDPATVIGQLAGSGIAKGQIVTTLSVVVSGQIPGRLVVGVRVSDPDLARLAVPGSHVTLFVSGVAEPVVSHVVVRAVPVSTDSMTGSRVGLLLVEVDHEQAAAIAEASSISAMTVALG